MKSVKFKALPLKVRRFVNRMIGKVFDQNDNIPLNWLHSIVNWSKATDEERLAYAEWKYPKGTKITCIYNPSHYGFVEFHKLNSQGWIYSCGGSVPNIARYIYARGKWASIISEPEKEDFEMNASIKRDVEQVLAEDSEPTFKAGEYVEGIYAGEGSYGEFWFTGGKTKDEGRFICEDKHGGLLFFTEIRKIDPDKTYREIAKEMIGNARVHEFTSIEYITVESAESMLIEALKKGKEL